MASRLIRTNPVTVNDILKGHTGLEIDCPDRVYLTLSVPNLVVGGQVVSFLTQHEGKPVPSPVLLDRGGQAFRQAVASYAEANHIPVIRFGGRKDKRRPGVMAENPWPERKAGIGFRELSNGFAACEDPYALQDICDRFGHGTITVFAETWWARLPLPFTTADRDAGYWWDISMCQIEVAKKFAVHAITASRRGRPGQLGPPGCSP
jgi:hypothetical protein